MEGYRPRTQTRTVAAHRSALSWRKGRRAEQAVADYLFASGFAILGRNVRVGFLELDIVARKAALVVVVEVRTRGPSAYERAFESIGPGKRARLRAAVDRLWRECLVSMRGVERLRIDAAEVTSEGERTKVEYVAGAIGPF
jgi:putative endonuclease